MQFELDQLSKRMNGEWSERIKAVEYGVQKIDVGQRAVDLTTEMYYQLLAWFLAVVGFGLWLVFKVVQGSRFIISVGSATVRLLNWTSKSTSIDTTKVEKGHPASVHKVEIKAAKVAESSRTEATPPAEQSQVIRKTT